jgi:hypothetical protein
MVSPLGVLAACPVVATTKVEDIDGGPPRGCGRQVRQQPPPKLNTSMAGLGMVLAVDLAATTTEFGDVDGGPPGGCWWQVRQWPPLKLAMLTVGPLEGAGGRSGSGHHQSWRRRWWAP